MRIQNLWRTRHPFTLHVSRLLSILNRPKHHAKRLLQLHAHLITTSLISHPLLSSALLFAFSEASPATKAYAELLFSQLRHPTTFAWNTIIRLCASSRKPMCAIQFFAKMRRNGVCSDNYTYPSVLKAFGLIPGRREGVAIHGEVIKIGFEEDLFVTNGLISFYSKSGEINAARRIFDAFCLKDLVSWNSIIAGYVSLGDMGEAQELFDKMPKKDNFSWAILIHGYGRRHEDLVHARRLFDVMAQRDSVCWNSIINGYASHGELELARELFEAMPETTRSIVSWSILIDGYVRHGDPKEALLMFRRMLRCGCKPDKISMVGAIASCAQLGTLDQGQWIHSYMKRTKIASDIVIETALIDMYVKCGRLELARKLFECMQERNAISWNVMIVGLGINGFGGEALEFFLRMEREGTTMDDLTIVGVLNACAHAGLVTEGLKIFDRMRSSFGVEPKVEHYACLVDLLGRAGRLQEARHVIETMPMKLTAALWGSLLAASRTYRCVQMAELSVEGLINLRADDCGVYTLLSNIYAEEGMWENVWKIRKVMSEKGLEKETGRSFIEVHGSAHEFVNKDFSHSSSRELYAVIWSLSNIMTSER